MGDKTGIEWTDATWNPVSGCSKVSQGCKHCYAERVFPRTAGPCLHCEGDGTEPHTDNDVSGPADCRVCRGTGRRPFTDVRTHPDRLDQPLRWRKPRRVFVNSMSDLFHEDVPFEFIEQVHETIRAARQHEFQILTKRPAQMLEYWRWRQQKYLSPNQQSRPPENAWYGVSVEDQATADERIPLLLQTPAAVRFLSCEPLLGPLDIGRWLDPTGIDCPDVCASTRYVLEREVKTITQRNECIPLCPHCGAAATWTGYDPGVDWVIVGGESGPGARRFRPEWARAIGRPCRAAGVPVFIKQMGSFVVDRNDAGFDGCDAESWPIRPDGCDPEVENDINGCREEFQGADCRIRLMDRKGGDPAEWPEDLRVREFPR